MSSAGSTRESQQAMTMTLGLCALARSRKCAACWLITSALNFMKPFLNWDRPSPEPGADVTRGRRGAEEMREKAACVRVG